MEPDTNPVPPSEGTDRRRNRLGHGHPNRTVEPDSQSTRSALKHPGPRNAPKIKLLTERQLDGRTRAKRHFVKIIRDVTADLDPSGHGDGLSTVTRLLVEALAGAATRVRDLHVRMLRGESTDLLLHSQALSTLVRVAARLPTNRVLQDVPDLKDYLAARSAEKAAREQSPITTNNSDEPDDVDADDEAAS